MSRGSSPRRRGSRARAARTLRIPAFAGMSASASGFGPRGESPLQACALRPVAEGHCVAARRGGEQPEVNVQSATPVNSIRPGCSASLLIQGEAWTGAIRKSTTLRGSVAKRSWRRRGGWRRKGRKARPMTRRDLRGPDGSVLRANPVPRDRHAGVRGAIVATKPGNAGGAKGSREMDAT